MLQHRNAPRALARGLTASLAAPGSRAHHLARRARRLLAVTSLLAACAPPPGGGGPAPSNPSASDASASTDARFSLLHARVDGGTAPLLPPPPDDAGAVESGTATLAASCAELTTGVAACDPCARAQCCADMAACAATTGCAELADCLAGCAPDDGACVDQCTAAAPAAVQPLVRVLGCLQRQCSEVCQ